MTALSTVWPIGKTPIGGVTPNLRGLPALPPMPVPVHLGVENLLALGEYTLQTTALMRAAQAQRAGLFDLRAESIWLTMHRTIVQVGRWREA